MEKTKEIENIVSCMRCGNKDFESILRKVMGGDETVYICDACYDQEWDSVVK